jgi:eukaryotic-like serine/threonine-protein kinase
VGSWYRHVLVTAGPQSGTLLGRYEVLEPFAHGGMATIYLARQRKPSKMVALKLIKEELVGRREYLDMFKDEAKILSKLKHPNIVETLEAGVAKGRPFIAMELLLGRSVAELGEICAERRAGFPFDLAAWIGARVADALHYAHELADDDGVRLNVIHRDANPSNIFVTYDGRIKLIDFGLVRARRRATRSTEGIVKGKVPYLSPEQVGLHEVDHRSDLYTLGAALWEMTTGKRLWKRKTDVETVRAIRVGVVPDPTLFIDGYPDELWAIVWEALMPQRDHRYLDAATMARDLDAFVRVHGARGSMAERAAAFVEDLFPGEAVERRAYVESKLKASMRPKERSTK